MPGPNACTGGTYQGDFTSCSTQGICSPATTTTLPPFESTTTTTPPTTSTTLPAVGACCAFGDCFVTVAAQCFGAYQGDGTTCTPGICSVCGNGQRELGEECDDGDTSSGDGCSSGCVEEECYDCFEGPASTIVLVDGDIGGGLSVCEPADDGTACDDGDICTLDDECTKATCSGNEVIVPAACEWVMVGGDPSRNVQSRVRGNADVIGDICGDTVRIGDSVNVDGDIVATASSGRGIFFAAASTVSGDVITDGAAVVGKPRGTLLPGLATDEVPSGATATGVPSPDYDTTGNSTRVEDCDDAQSDIDSGTAAVDALPSTQNLGDVQVKGNQSLTINATNVGGLNVIDFERLRTGNNATITLDGGGSSDTIFVLRVEKKLDIRFLSDIVLANGTSPGHVLIVGHSKCKIGEEVTGGGTLLCPEGKLSLEERVQWFGAILGGKKRVQLRDSGDLTHAPLQIGG
ncbi:MAG TPA: ice-binding family protein [Candidatus Limnocylindrales bacterium]|nr:ice-binding family protein [Candidatus Limnocylindrales bacterium]